MITRTFLVVTLLAGGQPPSCSSYTAGPDRPPVAVAGADLAVVVENTAEIDGSGSFDPEGEPLEFIWSLVAAPEGGGAELSDPRGEVTSLTPDAAGAWLVRLTVFDGVYVSEPDLVRILAVAKVIECQTDADCDDSDPCTINTCGPDDRCVTASAAKDSDSDGHLDDNCPGGDDCDDSSGDVHPGQTEGPGGSAFCTDLLDNDCDGQTDGGDPGCSTDWWNTDWTRRRQLVFDNSGQPENLDSFPVLVKLNSGRIDYGQTKNLGEDLRFLNDDDQTVLAHEIELWVDGGDSFV